MDDGSMGRGPARGPLGAAARYDMRMDDALVQAWRGGDPRATTAVRNGIRSIAERVLAHPHLLAHVGPQASARLENDEKRREITAAIAVEVMRRRIDDGASVLAHALSVAGRHAVQALQEGRARTGDAHLPPPVLVTMALAPDGIAGPQREAFARHLGACAHCAEDITTIQRIVQQPELADHRPPAEAAPRPLDVDRTLSDAFRAAATADAPAAPLPFPSRAAPGRPRPALDPRPAPRRAAWPWALAALLVAGVAVAWATLGGRGARGPVAGAAALADRTPPDIARLADLPPAVQHAVGDLARGDCRTAAGRFKSARRASPDDPRLPMLEGASWVCVGDVRSAQAAFAEMDAIATRTGAPRPRAASWYQAQAALLAEDADRALVLLSDAQLQDPKHRDAASAQLKQVEALLLGS